MEHKLPAEFKTKWLEALRSGKYRQDHGYLRTARGYCCLGVAVDLVDPTTWDPVVESSNVYKTRRGSRGKPLPDEIGPEIWHVLEQHCDGSSDGTVMGYLIHMNDGERFTFERIATWIEENL